MKENACQASAPPPVWLTWTPPIVPLALPPYQLKNSKMIRRTPATPAMSSPCGMRLWSKSTPAPGEVMMLPLVD